ncbi:peptide chain release factor N(5)-glutamine methyltransferase [Aureisphaera galaxeae]|uniref:peptide chain release factor N(5)-glutamine methyltransferase n=1 Tax=Aureisphaera galaxeae TaxID=1538023 RepID=UPI00234FD674|nr:peptide chain release factor N(5)-glutamine methyltransferase [Aureisphaera galaxeae]MDC8004979.1 peptide chain release factor N(5)-glutamine methyltransferase [Aureisphaera galaxeae]
MKLGELKTYFQSELADLYPKEEVQSFFSILLDHYLNYTRLDAVTRASEEVSKEVLEKFKNTLIRLRKEEPIQYIVGETEFYGLPFKLNEHTLIPRPETEELVEWISETLDANENTSILDIGTGSGCIAISLAKHVSKAKVSAMDISEGALKMAKENARQLEVTVNFIQKDILHTSPGGTDFDVIVSNPPYVRELEKKEMKPNVLQYEPDGALFVSDEDPLVFYRAIARYAKASLKPDGFLFFEINEYLSEEMIAMLSTEGYVDIVVRKDIFGKDRMIKCTPND